MGDSMVIKTDEINAEMVNYNKTKYDNNIIWNSILNQVDKIILPPRSNN